MSSKVTQRAERVRGDPVPTTFDGLMAMTETVERKPVELLPDPPPRERRYLIFSVDDHVCEPPDIFVSRVPARHAAAAPRLLSVGDGDTAWLVDGELRRWTGGDAVAGRRIAGVEDLLRSLSYAEMRPGVYDVDARICDMDIDGVYASVPFPSMVWGFCGQRIWGLKDPDLALACTQAYNDWMFEEWAGPHPDRIIAASIPYMRDPIAAAKEVLRNAERGFKALHFSENPQMLGLPSIHTRHWDPLLKACEESGTTINLHLGSSSVRPSVSSDTPVTVQSLLWPAQTMCAVAEWVYSKVAVRFPRIKIVVSEGGIGWVPMLRERMERGHRTRGAIMDWHEELTPAELLLRNFWFCSIEESLSMERRDQIGVDRIMLEVDYPHADTTWPETQAAVHRLVGRLPNGEVDRITHLNAADVYRHAVPEDREWMPRRSS